MKKAKRYATDLFESDLTDRQRQMLERECWTCLDMSIRAANAVGRLTVKELCLLTPDDLMLLTNIGHKSVKSIEQSLQWENFKLGTKYR